MVQQTAHTSSCTEPVGFPSSEQVCFADAPSVEAIPLQPISTAGAELVHVSSSIVHLDLERLACFEVVERQFEQVGVVFRNAIALHPSNPAFPTRTGETVLMGAPQSGMLEASFIKPTQAVSAFLTSSRRAVMMAFDANDAPVAQAETPGPNLAQPDAKHPSNLQLSVKAANIARISVQSFGGQFTIDEFAFG